MWSMLYRRCRILRATALVLDNVTAAPSLNADRQPGDEGLIEVKIAGGTDGTGTVTVNGQLDGSTQTETLTFSANGTQRTVKRFDALDIVGSFTTAGLSNEATAPTIEARLVGRDGVPLNSLYTHVAETRFSVIEKVTRRVMTVAGEHGAERPLLVFPYEAVWTPRRGDIVEDLDSGERWRVTKPDHFPGLGRTRRHRELDCEPFGTSTDSSPVSAL